MTALNLDAIEARVAAHAKAIGPGGDKAWNAGLLAADAPKLVAEVRRLRAALAQIADMCECRRGDMCGSAVAHDALHGQEAAR